MQKWLQSVKSNLENFGDVEAAALLRSGKAELWFISFLKVLQLDILAKFW